MNKRVKQILDHCDKWDAMVRKYGAYGMAKLIMKTPSYKAYIQKYPFDFSETWHTIRSTDDLADTLDGHTISVEEEVQSRLQFEELMAKLTPKEHIVFEGLLDGMTNSEIERIYHFNTNEAVRYMKHRVKRKYHAIRDETVNEYICKDCIWQWKQKSAVTCPKCDSRRILLTAKDLPID